jgi:hypothetical protein
LSDKEVKQVERKNDIIKRLETHSRRFSITIIFPFVHPFFPCANVYR